MQSVGTGICGIVDHEIGRYSDSQSPLSDVHMRGFCAAASLGHEPPRKVAAGGSPIGSVAQSWVERRGTVTRPDLNADCYRPRWMTCVPRWRDVRQRSRCERSAPGETDMSLNFRFGELAFRRPPDHVLPTAGAGASAVKRARATGAPSREAASQRRLAVCRVPNRHVALVALVS